jgi:hypothetical protein
MAGQAHTDPPASPEGAGSRWRAGPKHKNFGQDLQDALDCMQGSLETPLRGDPKTEPWEEWGIPEHKNKPARLNPPMGVRPS